MASARLDEQFEHRCYSIITAADDNSVGLMRERERANNTARVLPLSTMLCRCHHLRRDEQHFFSSVLICAAALSTSRLVLIYYPSLAARIREDANSVYGDVYMETIFFFSRGIELSMTTTTIVLFAGRRAGARNVRARARSPFV